MKLITLQIPENKLDFYLELFQSLGLNAVNNLSSISMSDEDIIAQAIVAENDITNGRTTSHDDFVKETKQW